MSKIIIMIVLVIVGCNQKPKKQPILYPLGILEQTTATVTNDTASIPIQINMDEDLLRQLEETRQENARLKTIIQDLTNMVELQK